MLGRAALLVIKIVVIVVIVVEHGVLQPLRHDRIPVLMIVLGCLLEKETISENVILRN